MIEPQERKTENFQTQLSMNKHYAFRQASSCQENESKGFCQKKMGGPIQNQQVNHHIPL